MCCIGMSDREIQRGQAGGNRFVLKFPKVDIYTKAFSQSSVFFVHSKTLRVFFAFAQIACWTLLANCVNRKSSMK